MSKKKFFQLVSQTWNKNKLDVVKLAIKMGVQVYIGKIKKLGVKIFKEDGQYKIIIDERLSYCQKRFFTVYALAYIVLSKGMIEGGEYYAFA